MTASGQSVALLAFAFALLAFVALRHTSPAGEPPPADALGELGAVVIDAEQALLVGQLACEALAEEERAPCLARLDDLQAAVGVARALHTSGEVCRRQAQAECLTASLEQARGALPELRRAMAHAAAVR